MGWPAGFKLNDNLDNFFGQVFLFYIDKWMGTSSLTTNLHF
jgi:hypothetical protein